ncbi:peptidylprolyl isomerase [soil metagenome]
MPSSRFTLKLSAMALVAAVFAAPAMAQTKEDKVVAVVNGHEIKTSEVEMAAEDILGQLPDLPSKLRYPYIVEYLVERHLVAQAAVKEGIAESEEYKRRLALYQAKALRDAYFAQKILPSVSEEEIKQAYDTESAKVAETERVRARHILVSTEQEAKQIEARLQKGEKFEDLAKQYSLDGSKEYGGDLGYFTAPDMVPEFSKAAFALQPGEISPPIKTDFGWHIIKVEDRKKGGAAPYDQVKVGIRNLLLKKKMQEQIIRLRMASKVELRDPDLARFAEEARKIRDKMLSERAGQPGEGDLGAGKSDLAIPPE